MPNPNRYASILRIRQQAEDRQAQSLVAIRQELDRAHRQRTSLEQARQSALEQAGATMRGHFDASDIRGYYQFERHIAHLRDEKDSEIQALRQHESEQQALLETATRNRRVAERLHGRRWERYRSYLREEERKILDETATMYAARARRAPGSAPERGNE